MKPAANVEAFVRDPVGRWVRVDGGLGWCVSPNRCGAVLWGMPSADEGRAMLRVFDARHRLSPMFDTCLDVTRFTGVDPDAFAQLVEWSRTNREEIVRRIRRRVCVVPAGLTGFALAGISAMLDGLGDVEMVLAAREACRRLCGADAAGDALHEEIEALLATAGPSSTFLPRLRVLLDAEGARPTVAQAARQLGLSTRSLQRKLAECGVSFHDELVAARLRIALRQLETSHQKIAAIAAKTLSQLVRSHTGQTPSEYRAAHRYA